MPSPRPPLHPQPSIEPAAIRAAIGELEARQPLNRADPRRPRRRVVRTGRDDRSVARGRRTAQRARQGDRGAGARRRCAGQRIFSHHQPLFVRNGRQGGHLRRRDAGVGFGADLAGAGAGAAFRRSPDRCRARRPGAILRRRRRTRRAEDWRRDGRQDRQTRAHGQSDRAISTPRCPSGRESRAPPRISALYWTPKMIREIIAFADQGHAGLNPIAARAVELLKQSVTAA